MRHEISSANYESICSKTLNRETTWNAQSIRRTSLFRTIFGRQSSLFCEVNMPSDELQSNYLRFKASWDSQLQSALASLSATGLTKLQVSYSHAACIEGWRAFLEQHIDEKSIAFFTEAQNDLLLSHIFAHFGIWRAGLQSLRSFMENACSCLYYKDHSVELSLWSLGKHRIMMSQLTSYFQSHPDVAAVDSSLGLSQSIDSEYATLSRAVHGSSSNFRMTNGSAFPAICSVDLPKLGMWHSRETSTIRSIVLLLVLIYHKNLQGTSHRLLREAMSDLLTPRQKSVLRSSLSVRIP